MATNHNPMQGAYKADPAHTYRDKRMAIDVLPVEDSAHLFALAIALSDMSEELEAIDKLIQHVASVYSRQTGPTGEAVAAGEDDPRTPEQIDADMATDEWNQTYNDLRSGL